MMQRVCLALLLMIGVTSAMGQSLEWGHNFGAASHDMAYAIATDAVGNVYLAGSFAGSVDFDPGPSTVVLSATSQRDIYILKLSPLGSLIWAQAMPGTNLAQPTAIGVDAAGNVYATGIFTGTVDFDPSPGTHLLQAASSNYFVQKLDANGSLVWAKGFGSFDIDEAYGLKVTAAGEVFITGGFTGTVDFDPGPGVVAFTAGVADIFVQKLNAAGQLLWAKAMPTTGVNWDDYGVGLATDTLGYLYVTGIFGGEVDFDPGAGVSLLQSTMTSGFILKLDPSGDFVWVRQAESTTSSLGRAIVACANGDILAGGTFVGEIDADPGPGTSLVASAGGGDGYLYRFDAGGTPRWFHTIGGANFDHLTAIAESPTGEIMVAGDFGDTVDFDPTAGTDWAYSQGLLDIYVQRLDSAGQYTSFFQLGGSGFDLVEGIVAQGTALYLSGSFEDTVDFDPYAPQAIHATSGLKDAFALKLNLEVVGLADHAVDAHPVAIPNPILEKCRIHGLPAQDLQIQVINAAGMAVMAPWDHKAEQDLVLDLSALPAGMYMVMMQGAVGRFTVRVARQ